MHAGAVEGQPPLAAEGVVDGPEERGPRSEDRDDQLGQSQGKRIEVPGGMAEEAMEPAPMPVADVAAGEDDFGDVTMTMREDPSRDDRDEGRVGGVGEDGDEVL